MKNYDVEVRVYQLYDDYEVVEECKMLEVWRWYSDTGLAYRIFSEEFVHLADIDLTRASEETREVIENYIEKQRMRELLR